MLSTSRHLARICGLAVTAGLLALAVGCTWSDGADCTSNADCPSGHRCASAGGVVFGGERVCIPQSSADAGGGDTGCAAGQTRCDGVCVDGSCAQDCEPGSTDPNCPCNYRSIDQGVCASAVYDDNQTCARPAHFEEDEASCDGRDNDCDGQVDEVGLRFGAVAPGNYFTCALTTDGQVYCWGRNAFGELGNGTTQPGQSPRRIVGEASFSAIAASGDAEHDSHACALTTQGRAYCWGDNGFGQLGDDSTSASAEPALVATGSTFASLSAGGANSCALTDDKRAYCWGRNFTGAIGDGTDTDRHVPTRVDGSFGFAGLSAGNYHACAITDGGAAVCWGHNASGQLGDDSTVSRPSPAEVSASFDWKAITAGANHSCGLRDDGSAYCWGGNQSGELGDGQLGEQSTVPVSVSGAQEFSEIAAGLNFTCAIGAADAAGEVFCWGNIVGSDTPVQITSGASLESLAAGWDHACAIDASERVHCWGGNDHGQLGNQDATVVGEVPEPQTVASRSVICPGVQD